MEAANDSIILEHGCMRTNDSMHITRFIFLFEFCLNNDFHSYQGAAAVKPATVPIMEPHHVRLSNGTKMPLIGMGTAAIKSPESIK